MRDRWVNLGHVSSWPMLFVVSVSHSRAPRHCGLAPVLRNTHGAYSATAATAAAAAMAPFVPGSHEDAVRARARSRTRAIRPLRYNATLSDLSRIDGAEEERAVCMCVRVRTRAYSRLIHCEKVLRACDTGRLKPAKARRSTADRDGPALREIIIALRRD